MWFHNRNAALCEDVIENIIKTKSMTGRYSITNL